MAERIVVPPDVYVPDLKRIDQLVKASDEAGVVPTYLSDMTNNVFVFITPTGIFEVKCPGNSIIDLLFAEQYLLIRGGHDPDEQQGPAQAKPVDKDASDTGIV